MCCVLRTPPAPISGTRFRRKKKAIKRYTKMLEQGRIKDETLFYNDMFNMTWEEAKEKYLTDVGR